MARKLANTVLLVIILIHLHLVLATTTADDSSSEKRHVVVPLTQHHRGHNDIISQTLHVAGRYGNSLLSRSTTPQENLDGAYWYGSFEIGQTRNLSLVIDTGSQDVAINANLYQPTEDSENLHRNGWLHYGATQTGDCGTANVSYAVYSDSVRMAGLTSQHQTFANVVPTEPSHKGVRTDFPHDGVVGFSGTQPNGTQLKGMPFFRNLCNHDQIEECRFGMALGTTGKGYQILGGVDMSRFDGDLSIAPLLEDTEWYVKSEILVNSSLVLEDQLVVLDTGSPNIIGPVAEVRQLFDKLGIQGVQQNVTGCTSVLVGYYPCHSPPQVAFRFAGADSSSFAISPPALRLKGLGNDNCVAAITGVDMAWPGVPLWIVGQPWFQGKYVDFDLHNRAIGVAMLKDEESFVGLEDT